MDVFVKLTKSVQEGILSSVGGQINNNSYIDPAGREITVDREFIHQLLYQALQLGEFIESNKSIDFEKALTAGREYSETNQPIPPIEELTDFLDTLF